jgi:hypothetical protein
MARTIKACMNCGEAREIAAHGLCFKCYRQEERKLADDLWTRPDPNAKELAKTQRKTRKALMKMMDALEEIESGKLVPQETVESWRKLLRPEVERIALSLGEAQVNSEHDNMSEPFTESAHELGERISSERQSVGEVFTEPAEPVNSEHSGVSELSTEQPSDGSERVNSEHATANERFTHPAAPVEPAIRIDQSPEKVAGTEQSSLLPPAAPQRITKLRKAKENFHAA